jgi:hypothetical protein
MECFICLNEIDISKNIFYLKCCNHYLHDKCIKTWLYHSKNNDINRCPYCRKNNNELGNLLEDDIDIIIIDNNYSNINIQNNNYSHLCSSIVIYLIILGIIIIILFFHV